MELQRPFGDDDGVQGKLHEALTETTPDLKDRALAVAAEGVTIVDARLADMPLV